MMKKAVTSSQTAMHLGVAGVERVDEHLAHALDGEDLLGDDEASEQPPMSMATTDTSGMRALRNACFMITDAPGHALGVAVRT